MNPCAAQRSVSISYSFESGTVIAFNKVEKIKEYIQCIYIYKKYIYIYIISKKYFFHHLNLVKSGCASTIVQNIASRTFINFSSLLILEALNYQFNL